MFSSYSTLDLFTLCPVTTITYAIVVFALFKDLVKMNQLQSLIHDALIATGHVSQCAILRRRDGHLVATSVGFQV